MQKSTLERAVRILLVVTLSVSILYFGKSLFVPLAIGGLLAMLFMPVGKWLENKGISRGPASALCLLMFLIIIGTVVGLLSWQISTIVKDLSQIKENLTQMITDVRDYLDEQVGISRAKQDEMMDEQTSASGGGISSMVTSVIGSVAVFAGNAILTLVYMLLLLYFRSRFFNFILKMVPAAQQGKTKKIVAQSSEVVQQYLSGLAIMIGVLWVMYGIGFTIVGVKSALFFAILCGVLEIIPYIGNITGCSLAALMALSQGGGSGMVLGVFATYAIVQFIQSNIIAPMILGSEVNINPLFIIIILIVGQLVWGLPGMIIAIPLLGISKIIFDNVSSLHPYGYLIGNEKKRKENKVATLFQKVKKLFH
ncbi:MAG: AI-2E family transporter [Chitinophagales bacterium]